MPKHDPASCHYCQDKGRPQMRSTEIIRQDGGYVVVAVLDDGTRSTPMGAPVRSSFVEAVKDLVHVVMTDTGPRFSATREVSP
jgi:hypothetical protein